MLAAYEAAMRRGAKDEAEWKRVHAQLYAEPPQVRQQRREDARKRAARGLPPPPAVGMSVGDAEAILARFQAADARYEG